MRAREDVAELTMDQAVNLLSRYTLITTTSISRLEKLREVPVGKRQASRRQRAYLLCLCYGVDPDDFDLDPDDLPPGLDIPARTRDEHGKPSSTNWYGHNPSMRVLRPAA